MIEIKEPRRSIHLSNDLTIDTEKVVRAAEKMIAQHGDSALAEADKKIRTGKSEGFDYVVWKLIREVIRDTQQSDTMTERYKKALNKVVFLSE